MNGDVSRKDGGGQVPKAETCLEIMKDMVVGASWLGKYIIANERGCATGLSIRTKTRRRAAESHLVELEVVKHFDLGRRVHGNL
jgi:hypothetical protein